MLRLETAVIDQGSAQRLADLGAPGLSPDVGYIARTVNQAALNPQFDRFARVSDAWPMGDPPRSHIVLAGYYDDDDPGRPDTEPRIAEWADHVGVRRERCRLRFDKDEEVCLFGRFIPSVSDARGRERSPAEALKGKMRRSVQHGWLTETIVHALWKAENPADLRKTTVDGLRKADILRRNGSDTVTMRVDEISASVIVRVNDPRAFKEWLSRGVGRQKGFGYGVLVPWRAVPGNESVRQES